MLLQEVLSVLQDHPHYGHRRIALVLGRNKKTVRRIMRKYGLKSAQRRRKRFRKAKDEGNPPSGIPNRIKALCPLFPNVIWVGDFTHLSFYGINLYLATVMDLFTREIVGWSLRLRHSAELVVSALDEAKKRRGTAPSIFHSDQGSEYAGQACLLWLWTHRVLPSHSAKSKPWENGFQETFYGKFKEELGNIHRFASLEELIPAIHHQMYYYNTKRIHSTLKMPPRLFFEKTMERIKQNKKYRSLGVS